jgi:hypothetical protein
MLDKKAAADLSRAALKPFYIPLTEQKAGAVIFAL